jgi:hypothetical protein
VSEERHGEWRELEAAGWEPEGIDGDETIWRNPEDGNWYEERRGDTDPEGRRGHRGV